MALLLFAYLSWLRRLMRNCRLQRRSRNLMLVPNLRPKVVPYGSRLLLDLIVRARRRLVAGAPPARCAQKARSPGAALGERGSHPGDSLPVAPLPQRKGLLALRSSTPAKLLPYPLLPEPVQPKGTRPGAADVRPSTRPGQDARLRVCRLPRRGHHPDPRGGEGEGVPQGTLRRTGRLRAMPLQDRVGLRVQGCPGGRPRRRGEGLRPGPRQLRRASHRRCPHSRGSLQRLPGRQGLLLDRLGATLAGGLRGAGGGHSEEQLPEGLAGGRSPLGVGKAPAHRAGHLATQGPLRLGTSPGKDFGWLARPLGCEGSSVHLWAVPQRTPRPTVAPSRGPLDLIRYASYRIRVFSSALCGVAGGGEGVKTVVAFEGRRSPRMEGFRRIPYDAWLALLLVVATAVGSFGGSWFGI